MEAWTSGWSRITQPRNGPSQRSPTPASTPMPSLSSSSGTGQAPSPRTGPRSSPRSNKRRQGSRATTAANSDPARRWRTGSEPAGHSVEGIEDEAEPDLELVAVVVAGLQDVPGGHLGKVGVYRPGHASHPPDLPACRAARGHPPPPSRARPGKNRHH